MLLVEDDIEISQMLKSYLEAENYEVICAVDGEEACEKFEKESYSLVLLDLMIPKNQRYGSDAAYSNAQYSSHHYCICEKIRMQIRRWGWVLEPMIILRNHFQ